MKLTKKTLVASTTVATLFAVSGMEVSAQENSTLNWTPRTIAEIQADAAKTSNSKTYTIKFGDTLSTIAAATDVDMYILAQINQISNLDLIFPDTVLKLSYDANNQLTAVEVTPPVSTGSVSEVVDEIPVTVTNETEVTPNTSETTAVATESVVTEETTVSAPLTTEGETSSATEATPVVAEVTEASITEEVTVKPEEPTQAISEAPVSEETEVEPTAPAVEETTEVPIVETTTEATTISAAPVVETVTEAVTAEETSTPTTSQAPAPSSSAVSKPENAGLKPHVAAYKEEVAGLYGITSFSLYRPGDSGDHGKGLAVDFMVPVGSDLGDQVAQYAIDTMGARNISYIIWEQKFYSPWPSVYGPAYTWNPMPDRGGVTANHYDHVHVSFNE
ncbi:LysM peptidoglycan-binding domain-containing protein [Streptococcus hillyeri]|uniref:LysM peptidoglycan-binding domain-containing protein n=1 Tax=Streptococcus hillyeri TaxID=2282420 RepID=A0A3L9DS91_9STRE|nr:LysM domain-containing protein [Streptococcus hillyeri]RLY03394.1 LysM peptidoglycan-binding domain-containing protein [Streptococcus hillyeri]